MRYLCLPILLILLSVTSCTKQNSVTNNTPSTPYNTTAIVVGDSSGYATIFRSKNRGQTWQSVFKRKGVSIDAVTFINDERIVAIGDFGTVYISNDTGNTWERSTIPSYFSLWSVSFWTPAVGLIVGNDVILKTLDSGKTWTPKIMPLGVIFNSVATLTDKNAIAVGFNEEDTGSYIYISSDTGNTWTNVSLAKTNYGFQSVYVQNPQQFWLAGTQTFSNGDFKAVIFNSADTGNTWKLQYNTELENAFLSVSYCSPSNTVSVAGGNAQGGLIDNYNQGQWIQNFTTGQQGEQFEGISYFTNSLTGIAVGYENVTGNGIVYITNDGGLSWQDYSLGGDILLYAVATR
ncbi:MAG: hypothetical protein QM528_03890 [Phycisphaerales bacterium]|nr:hypothetical protein [Phycisphaerales bacterium]